MPTSTSFSASRLSERGAAHLLVPIILVLGIIAGVYLTVTGNLKLFSKADNPPVVFKSMDGKDLPKNSSGIPQTNSPEIKIELTSSLGAPVFTTAQPNPSDTPTPQPEPLVSEPSAQTSPVGVGTTGNTLGEATSSTQVSGTAYYRYAENPTDLDKASYVAYTQHPITIDYTFKDKSPGNKFIWVEFKDVSGKVDRQTAQIELVSAISSSASAFSCTPCSADVSGKKDSQGNIVPDGYINGADVSAVIGRGCFNKTNADKDKFSRQCSYLDANGDGKIDMGDLNCIKSQFLKKCEVTPTPTVTPSPTPSPTPTPQAAMRVFVTSTGYTGDLGGAIGADAKCQQRAIAANLGGVWKAWISDSKAMASNRLVHSTLPYKLLDGTVVAGNWNDLIDRTLTHAINLTELLTKKEDYVWTGSSSDGTKPSGNVPCKDWTSKDANEYYGYPGNSRATDQSWSFNNASFFSCQTQKSLYCIDQTGTLPVATPVPNPDIGLTVSTNSVKTTIQRGVSGGVEIFKITATKATSVSGGIDQYGTGPSIDIKTRSNSSFMEQGEVVPVYLYVRHDQGTGVYLRKVTIRASFPGPAIEIPLEITVVEGPVPIPPPFVKVTAPNGGESIAAGSTYRIMWEAKNYDPNRMISIKYQWEVMSPIQNNTFTLTPYYGYIVKNVRAGQGYYDWNVIIGDDLISKDLKIFIFDSLGEPATYSLSNVKDFSDSSFKITGTNPAPTQAKRVFVTSTKYTANLGGLSGADAKCQERATAANLGGRIWRAWLSGDGQYNNAEVRLGGNEAYKLVDRDGTIIARNWYDLTDGWLQHPINVNEYGGQIGAYTWVWTNTGDSGQAISNQTVCSNFTNGTYSYDVGAVTGSPSAKNPSWTYSWMHRSTCKDLNSLYCFEYQR